MSAFTTYFKDFGTKHVASIIWFTVGVLLGTFVL